MKRAIEENIEITNALFNKLEEHDKEIKKIKKVKNMEDGKVVIERWEITKLIVVSLIVPLLNGMGFILSEWLNFGIWSWIPLVIVVNSISIPTIVAWLTKKFDKKELAMEVRESALKDTHAKEILAMKDEVFTERINAGLAKAELKIALDKIEKFEKID